MGMFEKLFVPRDLVPFAVCRVPGLFWPLAGRMVCMVTARLPCVSWLLDRSNGQKGVCAMSRGPDSRLVFGVRGRKVRRCAVQRSTLPVAERC